MIPSLMLISGALLSAVASYRWVRKTAGPEFVSRRLPALAVTISLATAACAVVLVYAPGQLWNYPLIVGAAWEWYAAAIWPQRRREAGGVRYPLNQSLTQHAPLMVAALALLVVFMEVRDEGWGAANLFLAAFGASQIPLFVLLKRAKPGLTTDGLLLFERSIPWADVKNWSLGDDGTLKIELNRWPGRPLTFEVDRRYAAPVISLLQDHAPLAGGAVARFHEPDAL